MSSASRASPEGLWQTFLDGVCSKLSAHVLRTWLRPIHCTSFDGKVATLAVRDQFMRDWLADHYLEFIRNGLTDVARTPVTVAWVVDPSLDRAQPAHDEADEADGGGNGEFPEASADAGDGRDDGAPTSSSNSNGTKDEGGHADEASPATRGPHPLANGEGSSDAATPRPRSTRRRSGDANGTQGHGGNARLSAKVRAALSAEASRAAAASRPPPRGQQAKVLSGDQALGEGAPEGRRLNKRYVFDNFVQGPSNQFAFAACHAAAQNPGRSYNPLFIYGGVGLGKTHLLSAIGHHILGGKKDAQIIYTSSEQFTNEVINAVLNGHLTEFRAKYLHHGDALLVDDIQLIAGKERTQHEFFHIFNTLYDSQRQIVVTSDKLPHEIPDIEERLRNRFQWGLIADVQPPEIETRIAILRKKAEVEKFELHNDVAFFLARSIRSNVRELEGALVRIMAHASLSGAQLTVDFARATLSDILQNAPSELSVESIQKTVASYFSIRVSELKGSRRQKALVKARQMAMYLCRKHLGCSYPELGSRFGDKDHTTVLASCSRVTNGLSTDVNMRMQLDEIEQRMNFEAHH